VVIGRDERRHLEFELLQLCDALDERVPGIDDVRELVRYGEYGVAFDTFVDRCITPQVVLSPSEFQRAAGLGEALRLRSTWVGLVACLDADALATLPEALRALAVNQVTGELATNAVRKQWLGQLRALLGVG
jgi:hypothetical protein